MAHVFWRNRAGEKVRIAEMSNVHLSNTIKMLRRNHKRIMDMNFIKSVLKGDKRVWQPSENLSTPAKWYPVYRALVAEANKRNLEVK